MAASSSVSVSEDVEHERKSKRKQDQMVDGFESDSEDETCSEKQEDKTEDESASKSVSSGKDENPSNKQVEENTTGKQKLVLDENTKKAKKDETKAVSSSEEESSPNATKKTMEGSSSSPNIHKGLISKDVNETAKNQSMEVIKPKVANNNLFQKKYSFKDEKKILRMMLKEGDKIGTKALWRRKKDSMLMSLPVNESKLYDKARRLKDRYLNKLRSNNLYMNDQEYKLDKLSDKIWGKDERAKLKAEQKDSQPQPPAIVEQPPHVKKNKEKVRKTKTMDDDTGYKRKYNEFLAMKKDEFPVAAALEVVPVSKRSNLEKKWEGMGDLFLKKYKKKTRLILETLEALKPSN